jgi:3-oxoacyl-[acyl-carrier protein] reductase
LTHIIDLEGKVALVTGGSRGIGLTICEHLAAAGADVAFTYHPNEMEPSIACETIEVHGRRSLALAADVSDSEIAATCFSTVESELGSVDILVCNAGIVRDSVLWKASKSEWDEVLSVNLSGAFNYLNQLAIQARKNPKPRSVVLISSINGIRGKFAQTAYSASKSGLIGLGRSAAKDLGKWGTRVNIVAPGMVLTELTDSLPKEIIQNAKNETLDGRLTKVSDVADAVLFLSSEMSEHITGVVLPVDGGQLL